MRRLHTILFLMLLSAADGLAHSWIYNNIVGSSQHRSNSSAPVDNLAYTYDGNRIASVNGMQYSHDANGNVTEDGYHETETSYNLLNLPCRVENPESVLHYSYLADGTKVAMTADDGSGYAYAGDMVFTRSASGTYSFESMAYGNGRIEGSSNTVRKYVTDHLGNVRAIVTGDNVVERNDYYPFGRRHPRNTLPVLSSNRWRLGAKETQPPATGSLVDFGARMYDPLTGRWTTQDPMAWKYLSQSPYNYCGNDSVNLVDPDGNDIWRVIGNSFEYAGNNETDIVQIGQDINYSISFPKGTISKIYTAKDNNLYVSSLVILGDIYAEELFEFLASNLTDFEWEQVSVGNQQKNFVGTSGNSSTTALLKHLFENRMTIRAAVHNHPSNTPIFSHNDKTAYDIILRYYPNAKFYLWTINNSYLLYQPSK